ncbi:penicillin-binding transpeptidase domain-containing protein [Proteinivorax tanatarense]|uniref:Penicillin-binding transpeptidase domain-containing protein n=1 Tax=Proteinivorax tanatarense TaxID=1260629 RepID=A0AAU7VJH9_9FIRM
MDNKFEEMLNKRAKAAFIIFLIMFGLLTTRLFWVQFVGGAQYLEKAERQWYNEVMLQPQRGQIYDTNGKLMAGSASAETIVAIPSQIENPSETVEQLGPLLELENETIYNRLTSNSSEVYLQRMVDDQVAEQIKDLDIPGIKTIDESKRFYPHGSLASHVLGFVGTDEGLEGIEAYYESELAGVPGVSLHSADASGRKLPGGEITYKEPTHGLDLTLTIDHYIQHIVETEMKKTMSEFEPESVSVIVADPNTGEILAMANAPDFEPENFNNYPSSAWRNAAITNSFEPGSTFKIATMAAGLEENVFKPTDTYICKGYTEVLGVRIRNWDRKANGEQTFTQAVVKSSNTAFVDIGLELGKDTLFNYIHGLGFGQRTGIDLPGEATGLLFDPATMSKVDLAVSSFGQGNSVTPIQQIMGVSAIANGGQLMQPYIAKEFRDRDGKVAKSNEPTVIRTVYSQETADISKEILQEVIDGTSVAVDGYNVAGKSGTAQKVAPEGGYKEGAIIASYVGFAPVEDPQIAVYVMVDEPSTGRWASQIAGPLFKNITESTLTYLEVPKNNVDYIEESDDEEQEEEE